MIQTTSLKSQVDVSFIQSEHQFLFILIQFNLNYDSTRGYRIDVPAHYTRNTFYLLTTTTMLKQTLQLRLSWKKYALTTVLFLFTTFTFVFAQNTVTGQVTDSNDEALPGVNVLVAGTTTGAITDIDGNYQIRVPDDAALIFSFVGYDSKEVTVGNRSVVNIVLEESISSLEEVVVVGYGTVKKKDLTGAVAQVDATKISQQSPNSVTDLLRANVPGLNVGFANSPKGVSQMEVRGRTTLNAGSQPLIVLDGMIYNGDLADINPQDIDKVDVMKDASSAAIYGSRGANGVILITTKRG